MEEVKEVFQPVDQRTVCLQCSMQIWEFSLRALNSLDGMFMFTQLLVGLFKAMVLEARITPLWTGDKTLILCTKQNDFIENCSIETIP